MAGLFQVPRIPDNAPFTAEQRAWLDGFLAGVFNEGLSQTGNQPASHPTRSPREPLLVLFGSQTGAAEGLAKRFAKDAERRGHEVRLFSWNDYLKAELEKASRLVVITSTWGDGDPPDNAVNGWSWLNSDAAPQLEHLSYAVLGLGDRNYSDFCGAGKKFDERLEALGGRRLMPRGECDVDFEKAAESWFTSFWSALTRTNPDSPHRSAANGSVEAGLPTPAQLTLLPEPNDSEPSRYSRSHPFSARLIDNHRLNRPSSSKDTRHLAIDLQSSGLSYEVGDVLGVFPTNCPILVEELLAALGMKGEEIVQTQSGADTSLHEALSRHFSITQPSPELVREVAARSGQADLKALLDPSRTADLSSWLWGRDIVDLLHFCPGARFSAAEFTGMLRKLQPRLYSISSSLKAHPAQVHLTVASVRYQAHGRAKKGVASCWLADRVCKRETPVPVFLQTSHAFRLPANPDTPIIMVGPGTGIAPFRAFLEQRRMIGARGQNWLFFGDQQRSCDFMYEEELMALRDEGFLTRLDVAFSRDQQEKIYVQHRMRENAPELWRWLEEGAHFYVCGDARRMAKDVDAALHEVISEAGRKSPEQAAAYVERLKSEKRYQRDVY